MDAIFPIFLHVPSSCIYFIDFYTMQIFVLKYNFDTPMEVLKEGMQVCFVDITTNVTT